MYKRTFFYIFAFVLSVFSAQAQPHGLMEVSQVNTFAITQPENRNEVTGYFAFYKRLKPMKDNDIYGIDRMDTQLTKTHSVKILIPKDAILLASSFNDSVVGLMFFTPEKKNFLYKSYDLQLNERGTRTEKPKSEELTLLELVQKNDLIIPDYAFAIKPIPGGKGFVRAGFGEKSHQYKITCFDNNFKNRWSRDTPDDSEYIEYFHLSDINEKYLAGVILRRKSMLSPKIDCYLSVYDLEKGKKTLDQLLEHADMKLNYSAVFLSASPQSVTVQGEYWNKKEIPGTDKSRGFFLKTVDLSTQKSVAETYVNWTPDMNRLLGLNDAKRPNDHTFHAARARLPLANGNTLLLLEQFRKTTSEVPPFIEVLGEKTGGLRIKTGHVLALEMNPNNEVIAFDCIEKTPIERTLAPGTDMSSGPILGHFVQRATKNNAPFAHFNSNGQCLGLVIIEQNLAGRTILHTVSSVEKNGLTLAKSDITSSSPFNRQFLPASTGRAMVSELNMNDHTCAFQIR